MKTSDATRAWSRWPGPTGIGARGPSQLPESGTLQIGKLPQDGGTFHAASQAVRRGLWDACALFVAAYRSAAEKLRAGIRDVMFPRGCFPPALPYVDG